MSLPSRTIGIDISRGRLDSCLHPGGAARGFVNDAAGIARLIERVRQLGAFVVLEATAPYDQGLLRALEAAELSFHRANPRKARDFARSAGFLAKTDRVDARMLAAYGAALPLPATLRPRPGQIELKSLTARRDQLVEMRKGERTRLAAAPAAVLAESLRSVIAVLDQQIKRIEQRLAGCISQSASLAADAALLRSAPGVGPVTAGVLLANLPELGQVSRRTVAALAGLAPLARDSGALRGKRHIWGGRKRVRDALYMAALTAIRRAPYQTTYAQLRATGKPFKPALIAVARKLLVALNAAIRDRKPFHAQTA